MTFTNRFGSSEEETRAYVQRMVTLVGDRDPLEVLCSTAAKLRAATSSIGPEQVAIPEAEGKWSVLQVLQHLADSEFAFGFRFRLTLGQEQPRLEGFDQDGWMKRLRYSGGDATLFLAAFEAMRSFNILLYRTVDATDLSRTATHAERGVESLAHMLVMNAAHDIAHTRQIERIIAAAS